MVVGRLGNLVVDREERVEGRHRVLQDIGDLASANFPHLTGPLGNQVLTLKLDAAPHDSG